MEHMCLPRLRPFLIDFTFLDALRLNVGVGLGGPFLGTFTYKNDTYVGFITGFYIAPYLGVSYAY